MLKLENTEVVGWEHAIRGMRNPKNSWSLSDSMECTASCDDCDNFTICQFNNEEYFKQFWECGCDGKDYAIGPNDHKLMMSLAKGGPVHAKYRRMITVYVDITAPLYWWKEFDTYKVGTVANSCSTMHKIHAKGFTLDDFSYEHLIDSFPEEQFKFGTEVPDGVTVWADDDSGCLAVTCQGNYHEGHSYKDSLTIAQKDILDMFIIPALNANREAFLKTKDKKYWWQMIQLLPTSYNQKRTVMMNYEVLHNIYHSRKSHKLDEWHVFCDWIEKLPYSEIITCDTVVQKTEGVLRKSGPYPWGAGPNGIVRTQEEIEEDLAALKSGRYPWGTE